MKGAKFLKFYLSNPLRIIHQIKYKNFLKNNPGVPWMAPKSIEFLDKTIAKDFKMLEWGSGGSSTWFAKRAESLISLKIIKVGTTG